MSDYKMRFCIGIEPEPVNVPVCIIFKCKERNIAQRLGVCGELEIETASSSHATKLQKSQNVSKSASKPACRAPLVSGSGLNYCQISGCKSM